MAETLFTGKKTKITPDDCILFRINNRGEKLIFAVNTEMASDMLLQDYQILHFVDNEETFIYRNGVYCRDARSFLKKVLYETFKGTHRHDFGPVMTDRVANEILARTCSMASTTIRNMQGYNNNNRLLNLENCVLNLDDMDRYEHSPDFKLLTKLPVNYDPFAGCPLFMEFLGQAVDKRYFNVVSEMMGYTLWPDYNAHKAFMFLGPKRTGKSTLIRVIEALNGHDNCSHVSLQDLVSQRFARARLFSNRINTYGDLPATAMSDVGIFKNVTGGDEIDAEYKGTQIFSFRNTAKLIYSANRLPALKVDDDAFYNRWIIIPFGNSFFGHEDTHLTEKLTTPEELSGILNFALSGLARLKTNDWQFSEIIDSGAYYRRKSNPVLAFLEDCCECSDTDYVVKADLLRDYNAWASEHGYPPATSKKAFGSIMQDQTILPTDTCQPKVGDRQVEAWAGIRLKKKPIVLDR
jgi:putative DNA primase/helicase